MPHGLSAAIRQAQRSLGVSTLRSDPVTESSQTGAPIVAIFKTVVQHPLPRR